MKGSARQRTPRLPPSALHINRQPWPDLHGLGTANYSLLSTKPTPSFLIAGLGHLGPTLAVSWELGEKVSLRSAESSEDDFP